MCHFESFMQRARSDVNIFFAEMLTQAYFSNDSGLHTVILSPNQYELFTLF